MGLFGSKNKVDQCKDILDELDKEFENTNNDNNLKGKHINTNEEDVFIDQDHFILYLQQDRQKENSLGIYVKLDNSFFNNEELFSNYQAVKSIKDEFNEHVKTNF